MLEVRVTAPRDLALLADVADKTGLFPGSMLPGMIDRFLADAAGDEIWLTAEWGGEVVGFCYAAQERLTEGTWNMLAIAVDPAVQGKGIGTGIVDRLHSAISGRSARLVIVDTSSLPEFAPARAFYLRNGYTEEARIREFWGDGNDKVVFWKRVG